MFVLSARASLRGFSLFKRGKEGLGLGLGFERCFPCLVFLDNVFFVAAAECGDSAKCASSILAADIPSKEPDDEAELDRVLPGY